MKNGKNRPISIIVLIAAQMLIGDISAEERILVEGAHLQCIKKHVSAYKKLGKNPLVVVLPECPNPIVTMEILEKYSKNSDTLFDVELGNCADCSNHELQVIISFSLEELSCLEKATKIDSEAIYDVNKISELCR